MEHGDKTSRSRKLIEEQLKLVYAETLKEGVPDRFVKLLNDLRQQEKVDSKRRSADGEETQ